MASFTVISTEQKEPYQTLASDPFHFRAAKRSGLLDVYSLFDDNQRATQHSHRYRYVNILDRPLIGLTRFNEARQTRTRKIHNYAVEKFIEITQSITINHQRIQWRRIYVHRSDVLELTCNGRCALIIIKNHINELPKYEVKKAYDTLKQAQQRLERHYAWIRCWRILISPPPQRGGQQLLEDYPNDTNFIHWKDLVYIAPPQVNEYAKKISGTDYSRAYVAPAIWDPTRARVHLTICSWVIFHTILMHKLICPMIHLIRTFNIKSENTIDKYTYS